MSERYIPTRTQFRIETLVTSYRGYKPRTSDILIPPMTADAIDDETLPYITCAMDFHDLRVCMHQLLFPEKQLPIASFYPLRDMTNFKRMLGDLKVFNPSQQQTL